MIVNEKKKEGVRSAAWSVAWSAAGAVLARLSNFGRATEGSVAILFALCSVVLITCAGVGIDYASALRLRREMQQALDAAVLAAATQESDRSRAATEFFSANLVGGRGIEISFEFSEGTGEFSGVARALLPSKFMTVVGIDMIPVSVESGVAVKTAQACIFLVDRHGHDAFKANGGGRIDMPDCEMHVHSKALPATWIDSKNIDVQRLCLAGRFGGNARPWPPGFEENCSPSEDPYKGKLPVISATIVRETACMPDAALPDEKLSRMVFKPGTYCRWPNINSHVQSVRFEPGDYVFKSGVSFNAQRVDFGAGTYLFKGANFTFNGAVRDVQMGAGLYVLAEGSRLVFNDQKVSGAGVTIHLADANSAFLTVQGNSQLELTAPTAGPYKGLALYEAPNLPVDAWGRYTLDGAMTIRGGVHLPSRNLHLNGNGRIASDGMTLVLNKLSLDGTVAISRGAATTGSGGSRAYLLR